MESLSLTVKKDFLKKYGELCRPDPQATPVGLYVQCKKVGSKSAPAGSFNPVFIKNPCGLGH